MATRRKIAGGTRSAQAVAEQSDPKTTRPDSPSRREPIAEKSTAEQIGKKLDAFPDRIDLRDWLYHPTLQPLPDQIANCVPTSEILNQGKEGACTGFALAAIINFLLADRQIHERVSPRMLYELARCYDEWPGEAYEGSSARGAMKAWQRHGVCTVESWPIRPVGRQHFDQAKANEAMKVPGGAYFRVNFREVRDVHAAIHEVGAVYATLMVHAGWGKPGPTTVKLKPDGGSRPFKTLAVIERKGRATDGHAVALVGYTSQGFIVQNSWGPGWGTNGFALLPYEDFMMHATDVWVAQLGVPVMADLWAKGSADQRSGAFRAGQAIPLNEIRPYVVDVGNDGLLSDQGDYWTTEADLERLFTETIPEQTKDWKKRRVMLYLHGGLNSEEDAAKRIIAYRDVCLANEIYPLHIMWETDWYTSAWNILQEQFGAASARAGRSFLDHLREAKDRALELTLALPGAALWNDMKENAQLASEKNSGAMALIAKHALARELGDDWEVHVVAHSAGSILAAHAIEHLAGLKKAWKTTQFMAPAIRLDEFASLMLPRIQAGECPTPTVYMLSDVGELDDDVGPYGKSLLYLVSNAFEDERETPLLGMKKFIHEDEAIAGLLLEGEVDGLPALVIAGESDEPGLACKSETHGGFDNDPNTMNSVLYRILGHEPERAFEERDLQF